jgi:hypothetical protein
MVNAHGKMLAARAPTEEIEAPPISSTRTKIIALVNGGLMAGIACRAPLPAINHDCGKICPMIRDLPGAPRNPGEPLMLPRLSVGAAASPSRALTALQHA